MKLTKREIKIWKNFQFFDKYGFFPFEKKRINLTIVGTAIEKLEQEKNKSGFVEKLILSS